jgi:hypothetical protein
LKCCQHLVHYCHIQKLESIYPLNILFPITLSGKKKTFEQKGNISKRGGHHRRAQFSVLDCS